MRHFQLLILSTLIFCSCQEYSKTIFAGDSPIKITIKSQGMSIQEIPTLTGKKTTALFNGLVQIDTISESQINWIKHYINKDVLIIAYANGATQTYKRWIGIVNPNAAFQPTDIYYCSKSNQYLKYDMLGGPKALNMEKYLNGEQIVSQIYDICELYKPMSLEPIVIRIADDPRSFDMDSFLVYHRLHVIQHYK